MARIGNLFVVGAMRAGYAARGLVYLIVGLLALGAATSGGSAEGFLGSLQALKEQPWNMPVLLLLAAGLLLYSLWRALDSVLDLAGHGGGFGWVERFGLFFVSLLHVAFAWYALKLAFGGAGFATQSRGVLTDIVSGLIGHRPGRWFVVLVGIGTISFGFYSVWKGGSGRYRRHMRPTAMLPRLTPVLAFGLIVRGIVLAVMGGFIGWAGWALDAGAAGGLGHALEEIHSAWHGRALLGISGVGLIAFSLYQFIESSHRVIPDRTARQANGDVSAR